MGDEHGKPAGRDEKIKTFEPPETHKAADRAGKRLGHMASAINEALDEHDQPVVLDRYARHVSIKELEALIDRALADNERTPDE